MAERHRSQDGRKETEEYVSDAQTPGHQGRDGGRLARKAGTRDELKRATEDVPGATRVRKSDTEEEG